MTVLTQRQIVVADLIGSFALSAASGTMAAGLAANSPIASFRWGGTNPSLALVRKIYMTAANAGTGFTAGTAEFDLFAARGFTVSDSTGNAATLTGNNGKLRTTYGATLTADFRVAATGTLTVGTRTLDATPLNRILLGIPATASIQLLNPGTLIWDERVGEQPLILANNEGFVIQATVPATGTWVFGVSVVLDEVTTYP